MRDGDGKTSKAKKGPGGGKGNQLISSVSLKAEKQPALPAARKGKLGKHLKGDSLAEGLSRKKKKKKKKNPI